MMTKISNRCNIIDIALTQILVIEPQFQHHYNKGCPQILYY
jgi:hypothetical protein